MPMETFPVLYAGKKELPDKIPEITLKPTWQCQGSIVTIVGKTTELEIV